MSFRIVAVCIAAALAVLTAGAFTASRASGAAPAEAAGQVVSMQARPGGGYDLRYLSTGVDGRLVEERAVLWVPAGTPSGDVVAWAHQTTGIADQCAPSAKASVPVPGRSQLLAAGDVVVAPDYEGLGSNGVHPYLVGESEGRSVLDAIRAARTAAHVHGASAAYGWSQGGHAVLFAGKLAPTYAPDVRLQGVAAMAPVTAVSSLVDGSTPLAKLPGVVAMVTAGYVTAYPELDPSALLGEPDEQLDAARGVCDVTARLEGTTTQVTDDDAWVARLHQNDPAATPIDVPMLFAQGENDFLLPLDEALTAAEQLCAEGSNVELVRYPSTGHDSVPDASLPDVVRWIGERLHGAAADGCLQREGVAGSSG